MAGVVAAVAGDSGRQSRDEHDQHGVAEDRRGHVCLQRQPSVDRDAHPLALAVAVVAAARLGDRYGRRRVMLVGLVAVAVINFVAGLASNGVALIASRAVLGVAGAMILASVVSTVGHTFRGHDLAIANGAWVTVVSAGNAVGPVASGLLTQAVGWRSVFFFLSPMAVATAALAWWLMPESRAQGPRARWDRISLTLPVATVGGMVYGIQQIQAGPFKGALFLAAGAASAVWFVHRQRWTPNPLIDISLFRRPGFARSATQILASAATSAACLYLVSLHLQHTLGRTPLQAGLALAPQAAATAFGGVLAPLSLRRMTTPTAVRAALVLQGAGLLALVWNDTVVLVPIALVGLGYGTVGTLATTALLDAATPSHAAQAGAIQEVAFASAAVPESPSSARSPTLTHKAGSSSPWPQRHCSPPHPPASQPTKAQRNALSSTRHRHSSGARESVATYPGIMTVISPSEKTDFSVSWHQSRASWTSQVPRVTAWSTLTSLSM
jgi:MFS transporter, DHA2 family, multidrug resistance protein